jgi:hypothetical protein
MNLSFNEREYHFLCFLSQKMHCAHECQNKTIHSTVDEQVKDILLSDTSFIRLLWTLKIFLSFVGPLFVSNGCLVYWSLQQLFFDGVVILKAVIQRLPPKLYENLCDIVWYVFWLGRRVKASISNKSNISIDVIMRLRLTAGQPVGIYPMFLANKCIDGIGGVSR